MDESMKNMQKWVVLTTVCLLPDRIFCVIYLAIFIHHASHDFYASIHSFARCCGFPFLSLRGRSSRSKFFVWLYVYLLDV